MKRYRVWDDKSGTEVAYGIKADNEDFRLIDTGDYISVRAYDADSISEYLDTDDYHLVADVIEEG